LTPIFTCGTAQTIFEAGKRRSPQYGRQGTPGNPNVVVEVAQNPGTIYTWTLLETKQTELAAKFGDTWAHPDPGFRPEFNDGSLGWEPQ
jgi:hypothetical protein